MTKTTIAGIVFGVIACIALIAAAFNAGHRIGREESQQDRIEHRVEIMAQDFREVEKRLEKIENWRDRWGTHGAPGAAQ